MSPIAPSCGGVRFAGRAAVIGACLLLPAAAARAGDPSPAPAPPPAPRPAATTSTAEQAADAVLTAVAAKDPTALGALAARDEPDPWLVADELLHRGEPGAAEAFAKAAPRVDTAALPTWVAAAQAAPTARARRDALERATTHLAAKQADEALAALAPSPAESPPDVVGVRTAMARGLALTARSRPEAAIAEFLAAGERAERMGWLARAALAYNEAGRTALRFGSSRSARETFGRALALHERRRDERSIAKLLTNLATADANLGHLEDALATYERSLRTLDALPDEAAAAMARSNIAELLRKMGDLPRARAFAEQALAAREALGDRVGSARTLLTLGNVLRDAGEFERARASIERARAIQQESGDRLAVSWSLTSLGNVLDSQGDHARALSAWERAYEVQRAMGARRDAAATLGNIGLAYHWIGDYPRALATYERAVAEAQAVEDGLSVTNLRINLGLTRYAMGDHEPALAAYRQALEVADRVGARALSARALGNIGLVHLDRGRSAEALEAFERALEEKQALGDRVGAARTRSNIGLVLDALGDRTRAWSVLDEVIEAQHAVGDAAGLARTLGNAAALRVAAGDFAAALPFARRAVSTASSLARGLSAEEGAGAREPLAFLYGAGGRAAAELDDAAAFAYFLESGRAGALVEGLGAREALWSVAVPADLREEEAKARSAESAAVRALRAAVDSRDRATSRARRAELDAALERVSAVVARIQREARAGASIVQPEPSTLEELCATLSDGEAMLLYELLDPTAYALVVTRAGARIVPLGPTATVEAAVAAVPLDAPGSEPTVALERLRAIVAGPLALSPALTHVFVSPSGSLSYVPFAPLFADRTVSYVASGTTHRVLKAEEGRLGVAVLALGDPSYAAAGGPRSGGHRLAPLPATRAEAKAVGTTTLLGADATEAGLVAAIATRPRWRAVHLACHGLVDAERPARSSLALTPSGDDDGLLTALEVFRMKIPADLVVLSACETGRGKVVRGEGIVGLTRAFLFAGAPRVVCSLWKVDDEATSALMTKFYELWNPQDGHGGIGTAKALRAAQAFVRGQERWRHPYYWAAWVLWGLAS